MQYNENLAVQIIAKHQLKPTTLRTWKHRQIIPDKYADENFEVRKPLTNEQDIQQHKNVLKALSTGKFVVSSTARLAGLKEHILADALQEKTRLSKQELIAVKKAINTIRNEAKAIGPHLVKPIMPEAPKKQLKAFVLRNEIVLFVLIGRKKQAYDAVYSWATGKSQTFPNKEALQVLQAALLVFCVETTL